MFSEQSKRLADALARPFHHPLSWFGKKTYTSVEFPFTGKMLEHVESTRSGDLNVRLDFSLDVVLFGPPRLDDEARHSAGQNFRDTATVYAQMPISIPQVAWAGKILKELGYGAIHIFEIPVASLEACRKLEHSYKALERAKKKYESGDYDDAVALCRTAVDPIRNELKKLKDKSPDSLTADWAEKIGASTVEWLTTVLGKTHGVANTPIHSPRTGHFARLDAHMILFTTVALVAYVARTKA
jgi:hypothetical protein